MYGNACDWVRHPPLLLVTLLVGVCSCANAQTGNFSGCYSSPMRCSSFIVTGHSKNTFNGKYVEQLYKGKLRRSDGRGFSVTTCYKKVNSSQILYFYDRQSGGTQSWSFLTGSWDGKSNKDDGGWIEAISADKSMPTGFVPLGHRSWHGQTLNLTCENCERSCVDIGRCASAGMFLAPPSPSLGRTGYVYWTLARARIPRYVRLTVCRQQVSSYTHIHVRRSSPTNVQGTTKTGAWRSETAAPVVAGSRATAGILPTAPARTAV